MTFNERLHADEKKADHEMNRCAVGTAAVSL